MATVSVTRRYSRSHWCIAVYITSDGEYFVATIFMEHGMDTDAYQEVLDGVPGVGTPTVTYAAETDQLTFHCIGDCSVAVDRALVAPALATALGARQPSNLDAKPVAHALR